MSLFSDNLRYLRELTGNTQGETAEILDCKRGRYEPWESGKSEPPHEMLITISRYYKVSIDLLLTIDLRKYRREEMLKLDDNRIVLPITVDNQGNNLIEIVPEKARAGYLTGYSDPEYIGDLPQISLPFLGVGKHRAFPVGGDSMPPHDDKSYVVGKYVENLGEIKKDRTYILITHSEGITYKRLNSTNSDSVTVEPDNIIYNPYEIKLSDILEIWEYVAHIGQNDKKLESGQGNDLKMMFSELKQEIRNLKS